MIHRLKVYPVVLAEEMEIAKGGFDHQENLHPDDRVSGNEMRLPGNLPHFVKPVICLEVDQEPELAVVQLQMVSNWLKLRQLRSLDSWQMLIPDSGRSVILVFHIGLRTTAEVTTFFPTFYN